MKFNKHTFALVSLSVLLVSCGGDEQGTGFSNNVAPSLDTSALEFDGSKVYESEDGLEWEIRFSENDHSFDGEGDSGAVPYKDIDLLTGMSDANIGTSLSVRDLQIIWEGPDCSDALSTAVNYEEICAPILDKLGFAPGDNLVFDDQEDVRELQNLPIVTRPIYGFKQFATHIRVTPSAFAPLLRSGQTAQYAIKYRVSDGESSVDRRLTIIVDGDDSAPQFLKLKADGSPDEPLVEVEAPRISVSEKSAPITINLLESVFDADVYAVEQREREEGDLANSYSVGNYYTKEKVEIIGLTAAAGIADTVWSTTQKSDPVTQKLLEYNLHVDPSSYADQLAGGETEELTFNFIVTDGHNEVPRSAKITVLGANLFNPPIFDGNYEVTTDTSRFIESYNLLEGVLDPDNDEMSVVNLVAEQGSDVYGVDLSTPNVVKVDPYAFLYLKAEESKILRFSYQVSDGELESETRTLQVTISGHNPNLLAGASQSDSGFEQGSVDASAWGYGWGPAGDTTAITMAAAHSGNYGFSSGSTDMHYQYDKEGISQGEILQGDRFYFNFFGQTDHSIFRTRFNQNANWDDGPINDMVFDSRGFDIKLSDSPEKWVEHTNSFVANDYFAEDTAVFNFTMLSWSDKAHMDDFSLVKYWYSKERDLVNNGHFTTGNRGDFEVSGDATIEVTEDANRVQNPSDTQYGLKILGGTAVSKLYIPAEDFPQGAIQRGIRYVIEFDMKNPSYVPGADALAISGGFEADSGASYARKTIFSERSETAWNTYTIHINTISDGFDAQGATNSDTQLDWAQVNDVQAYITIPIGEQLLIDNIKIYPIPQ